MFGDHKVGSICRASVVRHAPCEPFSEERVLVLGKQEVSSSMLPSSLGCRNRECRPKVVEPMMPSGVGRNRECRTMDFGRVAFKLSGI